MRVSFAVSKETSNLIAMNEVPETNAFLNTPPCFFRALFLVSSSKSEGFRLGLYLRLLRLNPSPAS